MSELLRALLIEEEGERASVYPDQFGYLTIGVGHLVDEKKGGKLPPEIIRALLDYDIKDVEESAAKVPGFAQMNEAQRAAFCSMIFQLGFEPFDGDGIKDFKNMLAALAAGDLKQAAVDGRDSKWAKEDTPRRAERQMRMLESGVWVPRDFIP